MNKFYIFIVFFIILSVNNVYAQMECNVPEQENNSTSQYISKPFYVRLYLHIIRNDDGSGGMTNQELEETIDLIKSIYNPHGIYFNICVDEIHDTDLMDGDLWDFGQYHTYDHIDVFIKTSSGGSSGVPSKYFVARNDAYNIAHELGHAMGLLHTFNNGCDEDAPWQEYPNGSIHYGNNADRKGDYVYDTPADVSYWPGGGSSGSCDHRVYVDEHCIFQNPYDIEDSQDNVYIDIKDPDNPGQWYLANNIMSYFAGCHSLITPGQAERIRHQITYIEEVVEYGAKPIVFNYAKDGFEIKIYQPVEWNDNRIFDGDIRVVSGGDLSMNGSFYSFTPSHKIILNSGSHLNINALVEVEKGETNCGEQYPGKSWGGIEVENVGIYSEQVVINIDDANIRDADVVLKCRSLGAIANVDLQINNSIFFNNHRALDIYGQINRLRIQNSEFHYFVGAYSDDYVSHIRLEKTTAILKGIKLIGPQNAVDGSKFYGIEAINSNLELTDSEISGWKYGIYKREEINYLTFKILNSVITDNYEYGIYSLLKNEQLEINGCDLSGNSKYGIFLDEDAWSDIYIANNKFGYSDEGIHHYIKKYFGKKGTFYHNNTFNNIDNVGIFFHNWSEEDRGALFTCNRMYSSIGDHIRTEYAIDPLQTYGGNEENTVSSGNKYASISGKYFDAKDLPDGLYVRYYWKSQNEEPVHYTGIHKIYAKNDAKCPKNPYLSDYKEVDIGVKDWGNEFNEWLEKKRKTNDIINNRIDRGDTTMIITIIENVTDSTAQDVTDILINLGPWLSYESAETFIGYVDMFTSTQILSVLSANPDVFLNSAVGQIAFGENSPLSIGEQMALKTAINRTTERTRLLIKLRDIDMTLNYIINQAIDRIVFSEDGAIDYDNMRFWLNRKGTYASKLAIASTYMSQGDYKGSVLYLEGILSNRELSVRQMNDVYKIIELNRMLAKVYLDNRDESNLNTKEIALLKKIAYSNAIYAKLVARAILEYHYGYRFKDDTLLKSRSVTFKKSENQEVTRLQNKVVALPNPSNGKFTLTLLSQSDDVYVKSIKLVSMTGNLVFDKIYPKKTIDVEIDLDSTCQSGVYLYVLEDTSGRLHKGKLLINK